MELKLPYTIIKKVEKYCLEYELFEEGDGIIIGVSGGADSIFLLAFFYAIMEKWKLKLQIVHVNHSIRGEAADSDEKYVKDISEQLCLPFFRYQADIPSLAKKWKMTEEEAGRNYRYCCFEEVRKECGGTKIAVAHHINDQAETVLFQLFRGSGLRGLGGMYPKKETIIRPLLALSKNEILETLKECGIQYCEDATNQENAYSRNFIRNEVFPLAEKMFQKKVQSHIAASASYLRDVMSYLEDETEKVFQNDVKKDRTSSKKSCRMERKDFLSYHVALQRELIFRMTWELAGKKKDITSTHIEQIRSIFLGETGKRAVLPYHLLAKREYEQLSLEIETEQEDVFFQERELKPDEYYEIFYTNGEKRRFRTEVWKKSIISERNLKKCCTKCFDYDKIKSKAWFRYPCVGDYFWLDGDGKRKKLSRFFIDEKIPPEQRKRIVVLAEGNHVLWIPEFGRCSAFYYISEESERILSIEEVKSENYTHEWSRRSLWVSNKINILGEGKRDGRSST